ncbi:MAG: UDP-N-acetylmuramoyl-L-alanine--D-glutamate ligase [Deltaproteobacteria bacterium]
MTPSLRDQDVLVIGLGRSGCAAARLLVGQGARVEAADEGKPDASGLHGLASPPRLGQKGFRVDGRDLIVLSPGVPRAHPDVARAIAAGIPVVGEVELGSWFVQAPIIGITGTNGKSTTTALCGEMLQASGKRTFVGGNLGTPLCEGALEPWDAVVLELSSFQLESIDRLRAQVGACLNLTPDHLDRYADVDAYAAAKARLFERVPPDGFAVVNADDPRTCQMANATQARRLEFGTGEGLSARPLAQGFELALEPGRAERFRLANPALRGAHNLANAMAAALCARALSAPPGAIQLALDRFAGLPHRLERVRERAGVEWINDSKATNVDSAAVALRAIPGPLWWIAGGRGKGAPYAPLRPLLAERTRGMLLIGEDAAPIARELADVAQAYPVGTLEAAVREAAARAVAGETVLLSPACASYDQFDDYAQRGERFRTLVSAL